MITNFKIYEDTYYVDISKKNKFKVGDYIYCINTNYSIDLEEDKKYKILRIVQGDNDKDTLLLDGLLSNHYVENRFISEYEYDANKYNL